MSRWRDLAAIALGGVLGFTGVRGFAGPDRSGTTAARLEASRPASSGPDRLTDPTSGVRTTTPRVAKAFPRPPNLEDFDRVIATFPTEVSSRWPDAMDLLLRRTLEAALAGSPDGTLEDCVPDAPDSPSVRVRFALVAQPSVVTLSEPTVVQPGLTTAARQCLERRLSAGGRVTEVDHGGPLPTIDAWVIVWVVLDPAPLLAHPPPG